MYLFLGTRRAFNDPSQHEDGTAKTLDERDILDMKSRVEITFPAGVPFSEAFVTVTSPTGVWANQSPDAAPAWVASDDEDLARLVSRHFGGIQVRDPLPAGERDEHAGRAHHFESLEG